MRATAAGVVTAAAYREFVTAPGPTAVIERIRGGEVVAAEEVDAAFIAADFAEGVAADIVEAARRIADRSLLAIRSSATVEDLADSSFAGQYRSLLEIDAQDADAVLEAVRLVFASLWHPAPVAYRSAFAIDGQFPNAIVPQIHGQQRAPHRGRGWFGDAHDRQSASDRGDQVAIR